MELTNWHFKRKLIAESYFRTIFSGVILSTTIFAERQTGLTNFLLYDLMPCAIDNDHSVVYVDLSNEKIPVTAAVLMALDRVLTVGNAQNVSFNFFKGLFVSSKSNNKKEFYLNNIKELEEDFFLDNIKIHLELIDLKINNILKKNKLLLIFDHAHVLVRDKIALEFSAFLRNLLIKNRDGLKPIYGTCDMKGWVSVFKNNKSPLNSEGASIHNLPALDRIFVKEVMRMAEIDIDIDDAMQCYKQLNQKPGMLLALVAGWSAESSDNFFTYCSKFVAEMPVSLIMESDSLKGSYEIHN